MRSKLAGALRAGGGRSRSYHPRCWLCAIVNSSLPAAERWGAVDEGAASTTSLRLAMAGPDGRCGFGLRAARYDGLVGRAVPMTHRFAGRSRQSVRWPLQPQGSVGECGLRLAGAFPALPRCATSDVARAVSGGPQKRELHDEEDGVTWAPRGRGSRGQRAPTPPEARASRDLVGNRRTTSCTIAAWLMVGARRRWSSSPRTRQAVHPVWARPRGGKWGRELPGGSCVLADASELRYDALVDASGSRLALRHSRGMRPARKLLRPRRRSPVVGGAPALRGRPRRGGRVGAPVQVPGRAV